MTRKRVSLALWLLGLVLGLALPAVSVGFCLGGPLVPAAEPAKPVPCPAAQGGSVPTQAAKTATADGSFYSVAFETKLSPASYPGVTRYMHFKEANIALEAEMQANPALAELGISVPKSPTGSVLGKSPEN